MNRQHLKTILWLRWHTGLNQLKRSGKINTVLTLILLGVGLLTSASMFFVTLLAGISFLPKAAPHHLLFLWDGIVVAFLFFWTIGLVALLQRSEVLSIDKLLHLPISPSGAFFVNYFSSFFSVSLFVFLPSMLGLCIALVIAKGLGMLVLFPLLAGFVLMVTALTYQFQGWLATLMVNKRRRRTIVVLITMIFILLCQTPYLFNVAFRTMRPDRNRDKTRIQSSELDELNTRLKKGELNEREYAEQVEILTKHHQERRRKSRKERFAQFQREMETANAILPPGWMAYGAMSAAENRLWPGLLGSLGSCLIGAYSLRRSYRSTLRFYRGEFQIGDATRKSTQAIPRKKSKAQSKNFLEKRLPGIPEQAAAVALGNLRSLMRAPEVKMVLLSPVIFFVIFGSMVITGRDTQIPEQLKGLPALGAIVMVMFSLLQLFQNQFGFDRDGFRAYVFSPVSGRNLLLGKNVSLAPIALGFGAITISILQFIYTLPVIQFAAALAQLLSAFLIVCLVGNFISIVVPMAVASGGLRSSRPKFVTSLVQFLCAMMIPIALAPIFIPAGIEALFHSLDWATAVPFNFLLSILELAAVIYIYRRVLTQQGEFLQRRQLKILETVTTKNE